MTKKFTNEEYQQLVRFESMYVKDESEYQEGALRNPLTREWAHDKFVDKEPEFHFILKDIQDLKGWRYHLVRNGSGAIILYQFSEEDDDNPKFKESEIKLWGFNPEMFDKKGV